MSWQGWLAFTLYVGAALNDGTPEQCAEIRTRVRPMLDELREDRAVAGKILVEIIKIMGPQWKPTGEWDHVIKNMLDHK